MAYADAEGEECDLGHEGGQDGKESSAAPPVAVATAAEIAAVPAVPAASALAITGRGSGAVTERKSESRKRRGM